MSWRSLGVTVLAVGVAVGLLLGGDDRELTPTSFGTTPDGFGALYDLLRELDLPVQRSFESPDELPGATTVWWIQPTRLCAKLGAPQEGDRPADDERFPVAEWVEAGGTAVFFLAPTDQGCLADARFGDLSPPLRAIDLPGVGESTGSAAGEPAGGAPDPPAAPQRVEGDELPAARALDGPAVFSFVRVEGWRVWARVDDEPFVVARQHGAGRAVFVADADFLENRWLDSADAALLAVDLALAFGVPRIDEREHGLRDTPGAALYLASSPALPLFLCLAALGGVLAWRAAALPPQTFSEVEDGSPTLEAFVASLAALYERTNDHAEVFDRVRDLTCSRLRRAFALPPDAPAERVLECARRTGRADPRALELLERGRRIEDRQALQDAGRMLDDLVEVVAG